MSKLGIRLTFPLFASRQVECTRFEAGNHPRPDEIRKISKGDLNSHVKNYINSQLRMGNTLWENVIIDLFNHQHLVEGRVDNFIKSADGTLVWIDPLTYFPSYTAMEFLRLRVEGGDKEAAEILKEFTS